MKIAVGVTMPHMAGTEYTKSNRSQRRRAKKIVQKMLAANPRYRDMNEEPEFVYVDSYLEIEPSPKFYSSLSDAERLEAQKLAQELLREVPTDGTATMEFPSPRGQLLSYTMTRKKLIAAMIYSDATGTRWWGDLVFKKDNGEFEQGGVPTDSPVPTSDEAHQYLRGMVAGLSDTIAPVAAEFVEAGLNPEGATYLTVNTKTFGLRAVLVVKMDLKERAAEFAGSIGRDLAMAAGHPDAIAKAKRVLVEFANCHEGPNREALNIYDPNVPNGDVRAAAAFLVYNGVFNVDLGTEDQQPKTEEPEYALAS